MTEDARDKPPPARGARWPHPNADGRPGPPEHWPIGLESPVPLGRGGREYPPRGSSRAPRGRRGDILDSALELFGSAGFALTSVQDIARGAQASVGSLYHHFAGKEDIAAALYFEARADYDRTLRRAMGKGHETAENAVRGLVSHDLRWTERNEQLARFVVKSRDPQVVGDRSIETADDRILSGVRLWLDPWIDAGAIKRLPIALLDALVLGPTASFTRHWLTGRAGISLDEAERILGEAAWSAVRS